MPVAMLICLPLVVVLLATVECLSPAAKYISKYKPKVEVVGDHMKRIYPKFRIEVVLSFGMPEEMIRVAETAVEENFSGDWHDASGLPKISDAMEGVYGAYWEIAFFEDPFIFANTGFRRSPSFVVMDVNGTGVSIMKE